MSIMKFGGNKRLSMKFFGRTLEHNKEQRQSLADGEHTWQIHCEIKYRIMKRLHLQQLLTTWWNHKVRIFQGNSSYHTVGIGEEEKLKKAWKIYYTTMKQQC
ncbi:hypothetical protein H5410_004997 [Solanum commersonii]|uniref:Uncharacterized protein n=1 Tax=Solanum commersonii TaxID=4109 RepID=A0A9J6A668_SOLCO|nr:hypothetical protein H5410_004997 [Solanum commersonii]